MMMEDQKILCLTEFENHAEVSGEHVDDPVLFSQAEEIMMLRRVQQGETKALGQLLKRNLGLVISLAQKHQIEGVPMLDLIAAGNIALIKAARYYREIEGLQFITCAVILARQLMLETIANKNNK